MLVMFSDQETVPGEPQANCRHTGGSDCVSAVLACVGARLLVC